MNLWQLPHSTGSEKERSESATASAEFFSELQTRSVDVFGVWFFWCLFCTVYFLLVYLYLCGSRTRMGVKYNLDSVVCVS